MDADALLRQLAPLPFPERQARVAAYARREVGAPGWRPLLTDLLGRGAYERRIALLLATVTADLDHVRAALRMGGPAERARVLTGAVRLGIGAVELIALLPELPLATRHGLARAVRRHATPALADALLPAVRTGYGEAEAAALLTACSAHVVAGALDELGWAVPAWGGLGHRHPQVVLDHVDALLTATPRALWAAELARVASGIAAATPHDPERVLALVERCVPDVPLPGAVRGRLALLARYAPARVAAVLLRPGAPSPLPTRPLVTALLPLPDDALGLVATAVPRSALATFLRAVPPSRRVAVHRVVVGDADADVPEAVLDLLPWAERHAVARRLLTRHEVADDVDRRLAVVARLPFAEAEPELTTLTRAPDAERRALGYRLLLTAAAASRDPAVIEGVVTGLTRLPNEQDPVRAAAVEGIAALRGEMLTAAAAAAAARVVADAVAARDCSWTTRHAAGRIATGLLRVGLVDARADLVAAGFAASEAVGRGRAPVQLYGLSQELPRAADPRVFEALAPRLAAEARVGDFGTALALAAGLGTDRAARLPGLQEFVGAACRAKNDHVVHQAIGLWLAPSATRDERVARVVRDDRSTVTIDAVARAVATRRTDLLEGLLRKTPRGRFLLRQVRFLPAVGQWWERWTPPQVAAFRTLAGLIAVDRHATVAQRTAGIRQLRGLPGAAATLRQVAADTDVTIAESALASMAGDPEPAEAVAPLLGVLDTDRARVAVPALRHVLEHLPPVATAPAVLALLGARKVTVRKDALWLLVDLGVPESVTVLEQIWHNPAEHRDVRRAVVPVLRARLDDPRSWQLLEQAVADPSTASAALDVAVVGVPLRHRGDWAQFVLRTAEADDDAAARTALTALAGWTRWRPVEAARTLGALVADLGRTGRWRAALPSLVQAATVLADASPLIDVASALLGATGGDADTDAGADRDRPVRQRLTALAHEVAAGARDDRTFRSVVGPLADVLGAEVVTRDLAVQVAVAGVAWDADPGEGLARVVSLADTPALAGSAASVIAATLRGTVGTLAPESPPAALRALSPDTAPLLRLAVVEVAGRHAGWPPAWRDELRHLRHHRDPDVVRAALGVFTANEGVR